MAACGLRLVPRPGRHKLRIGTAFQFVYGPRFHFIFHAFCAFLDSCWKSPYRHPFPRPFAMLRAILLIIWVVAAQAIISTDFFFTYDMLFPRTFGCKELSLSPLTTQNDAAPSLAKQNDFFNPSGILFLAKGQYNIRSDLKLTKTVYAEDGAVFFVAQGVTLNIAVAVHHPNTRFFDGPGTVTWGFPVGPEAGLNPVVPVEWFGAAGDGVTDDSAAIQRALDSEPQSLKFSNRVYGLGQPLVVGSTIYSEAGTTLKALKPGLTGLLFPSGGSGMMQLPILSGFAIAIQAYSGMTATVPAINGCGTAIYVVHPGTSGGFGVRFDVGSMTNCQRGVVFRSRAPPAPGQWNLYIQGSAFNVGKFEDTLGVAKSLVYFQGPNRIGWDSNHFEFGEVKASQATGFALLRCDPSVCYSGAPLPKINLLVTKALQPLSPDSKLVDGELLDCELQLKLTAPLAPSQTAMQTVFNNYFKFYDPPAVSQRVHRLVAQPDLQQFKELNFGQPVHSTRFAASLPQRPWQQGEAQMFYLYHQLAQDKKLYFITEARYGGKCNPDNGVAVLSMIDNSGTGWKPGSRPYEVMIQVIACRAIAATELVKLTILAGTPAWP